MKKTKRFITILLMMAVILGGCGNKSKEELTDIEQFRCQDSMDMVRDILGESELKTGILGAEYYEYEELNLFGYNGSAIFKVRNDKDTIQSFCCNLQLNKKEFEDVLSQLKDKYGEYKKNEYTNQITYVWELSEDKAKEIGYNRISLSDKGDKKAVVDFSDEWSIYKDDAYYKHLEEEKQKETELNLIASEKYKVDGEDVGIVLSEKDGMLDISIMGNANSEEKASIMLATYVSELEKLTSLNSYSVCVFCDKLFVTHSKNSDGKTNTYGTNADGSMAFSSPDWLKTEITMSDGEFNIYVDELIANLDDFFASNSNDKKQVKEGNDVSILEVTGEHFYIRGKEKARYFLIVKNTSEKILEVKANVIAKDRSGNILGAESERLNAISPNQEMVMGFYFDDAGTAEKFEYDFEYEESKYTTSYYDNLTWETSINKNKLIVQITNNGSDDVKYAMPYALFFNNGEIFSHEYSGYIEIKAGKTVSVELECFDGEFEEYKLYISAWGNK